MQSFTDTLWKYFFGIVLCGLAAYGAYEAYKSSLDGQHCWEIRKSPERLTDPRCQKQPD